MPTNPNSLYLYFRNMITIAFGVACLSSLALANITAPQTTAATVSSDGQEADVLIGNLKKAGVTSKIEDGDETLEVFNLKLTPVKDTGYYATYTDQSLGEYGKRPTVEIDERNKASGDRASKIAESLSPYIVKQLAEASGTITIPRIYCLTFPTKQGGKYSHCDVITSNVLEFPNQGL